MAALNSKFWLAILFIILGICFYYLIPIITPFLIAILLAYLSNPLVKSLMRYGMSRLLAVIFVFFGLLFGFILLILLLIPFLHNQTSTLDVQLPQMLSWLQTRIMPWFNKYFDTNYFFSSANVKAIVTQNVAKTGGAALFIWHSGKAVLETILNIILIPVVTFYLLRDWDSILTYIKYSVPAHSRPTMVKLATEIDYVLKGFFRGTLIIMLFFTIYYSIALSLIGLQLGIVIGLIVGLTSIVPYLGLFIGIVIAIIAALVEYGTFYSVLSVIIVFAIGHSIENFYLTPCLIGNRIGLHPVLVLFALLAGGGLFGISGVLLALPVAAILLVLLRHFVGHYQKHSQMR